MEQHRKELPWMARVQDSELCPAELFVDSTGEVTKWQVVVLDLPYEKCKELNALPTPAYVTVELVAFGDLSFWGAAVWSGFNCSVAFTDIVAEMLGVGPLVRTRAELTI